jgi:hypothetical protein
MCRGSMSSMTQHTTPSKRTASFAQVANCHMQNLLGGEDGVAGSTVFGSSSFMEAEASSIHRRGRGRPRPPSRRDACLLRWTQAFLPASAQTKGPRRAVAWVERADPSALENRVRKRLWPISRFVVAHEAGEAAAAVAATEVTRFHLETWYLETLPKARAAWGQAAPPRRAAIGAAVHPSSRLSTSAVRARKASAPVALLS